MNQPYPVGDPFCGAEALASPDPYDVVLGRFVALEHERRELEERLESIKKESSGLQNLILEHWANIGRTSTNQDGLCIYVTTDFYASKKAGVPTDEVCKRLESIGLGRLVAPAYNAQSLKAWIKEQVVGDDATLNADALPDELSEVIQFGETPRLRARKG